MIALIGSTFRLGKFRFWRDSHLFCFLFFNYFFFTPVLSASPLPSCFVFVVFVAGWTRRDTHRNNLRSFRFFSDGRVG
ncbi:hypothetical protein F4774DRAFT_225596 [Daldinia eschscholtzii]|nr:hypothetical protein F4774DRAFT_225596 [Daldinia eschscholtzii]